MLKNNSFSTLTVDEIAKKAVINRGTFYRYFENKNALLDYCEGSLLDKVYFTHNQILNQMHSITAPDTLSTYVPQMLTVIGEHLEIVNVLLNQPENMDFHNKLQNFFCLQTTQTMEKFAKQLDSKKVALIANYNSAAVLGIIAFWGQNQEYTLSEIIEFLKIAESRGMFGFIK